MITLANRHSVLVIGAGIAGLYASFDLARVGIDVYLVEQKPRLGGHTALLCKVSPTLENAENLVKPLIQNVIDHPNIQVLSYCEIEEVLGSVGNFKVNAWRKARYVDEEKCTVCGECAKVCPVDVPREYEMKLTTRKAIFMPHLYPFPRKYLIDEETCIHFKDGSCSACRDACPENAIIYEEKSEKEQLEIDAIIVATGFKPYDARKAGQYKYGVYRNVVTGMEYERLCSSNGPTCGKILRISDKRKPKTVAYVLCVGSREEHNNEYCCRVGCLNALKHAYILKNRYGDSVEAYICYIDMRAVGRKAEEFYRTVRESPVVFIHGEPSEVRELPDKSLSIDVYDQATSKLLSITVDLVVLEVGLEPNVGLQRKLKVPLDVDGFFKELHPTLATTETPIEGIFMAGAVQQPMNLVETVAYASDAAMRAYIATRK